MAFHVHDPETDAAVRELATLRGVGLTEAVRQAVADALEKERAASEGRMAEFDRKLAELRQRFPAPKGAGLPPKAFFDEIWGEE